MQTIKSTTVKNQEYTDYLKPAVIERSFKIEKSFKNDNGDKHQVDHKENKHGHQVDEITKKSTLSRVIWEVKELNLDVFLGKQVFLITWVCKNIRTRRGNFVSTNDLYQNYKEQTPLFKS